MGISSSLSNAISGLNAASRAADVVSSNVANALNENYARRELDLSARSLGGNGAGVKIDGISRMVDPVILSDRRAAQASQAGQTLRSDFLGEIEMAIGQPGESGSLADRIAGLEAALIEAAARPEAEQRLNNVLRAAKGVVDQIDAIADRIQGLRGAADASIGKDVTTVNDALQKVYKLNVDITKFDAAGRDTSALQDLRQTQVDRIASIVPLREAQRANGQIALFTTGGAILLDGLPAALGFSPVATITEDMTQASGALSGLTINGRAVATSGLYTPIAGGSLEAAFAVRDSQSVAAQSDLDALTRDLVERFQTSAADPTILDGDTGLFTDAGGAFTFDPGLGNDVGLSQRLRINALVDPEQGGALWHLRDGLGAPTQGPGGYSAGILALKEALTGTRVPVSGSFMGGARTFSGLASDFLSQIGAQGQAAQGDLAYATSRAETLRAMELSNGVDTDAEMQQLLLIEQAYSANARVIQTVDDMIQTILEL